MRKADKENAIVVCTIVLCFMLTLGLCLIFSGEGFLNVFQKSEDTGFYAIATGGYSDMTLARSAADLLKQRGGAGYVFKDGDNIEVIISVYKDQKEAESVRSKLGDESAYIKNINVSGGKFKWCKAEDREAADAALTYFDTAFNTLYDVSNKLADNTMTVTDAKAQITVLSNIISDLKSDFYEKSKGKTAEQFTEIKLALVTAGALLDNIDLTGSAVKAAATMRYNLVQLVFCRQALMAEL